MNQPLSRPSPLAPASKDPPLGPQPESTDPTQPEASATLDRSAEPGTTSSAPGEASPRLANPTRNAAIWLIVPCLVLVALHVSLALTRDRPMIFADEAGYIGNARYLAGGIPIKLINSGAYYPGYSLLLTPIVWLGLSPPRMYQAILIFNGLLLSSVYLSLVYWIRRVLGDGSKYAYAIAFVASLYPTFLIQPLFAMSESAVIALSAALPLCVYWLIESKRTNVALLFGAMVAFQYAVHPRYIGGIGVAVVGLVTLVAGRVLRWPALVAGLGSLGLGVLGSRALTDLVTLANQGNQISEGQRLVLLTTLDGMGKLAIEMMGQFWYLAAASGGLVLLGVVAFAASLIRPGAGGRRLASPTWNAIAFLASTAILAFGVSSLFMSTGKRVDQFIYGRYNEGAVAPFIATGLWALLRLTRSWRAHAWRAALVAGTTVLFSVLLLWVRGDAWLGRPNLANVLAIVPQLELFGGAKLLHISAIAVGAYVLVAAASCWKRWLGVALTGAAFLTVGYFTLESFLAMQKGRAARQVLFDRVAELPSVDAISYDKTYFDPVTVFFGQYFLPNTEFNFFESGQGERPTSSLVLGHQKWSNAKSLSGQLIGKDRSGYSLWDMNQCCTGDAASKALGVKPVAGVEEHGFHTTEAWSIGAVRWTNGDAQLSIPTYEGSLSSSNLYLDIASVGPARNRIVVSANGRDLFNGRLGRGRTRLLLPLSGVPKSETLELRLKSKTFVPSERSESTDSRELGIAIRAVRIIRECCLPQRNPFDDAEE